MLFTCGFLGCKSRESPQVSFQRAQQSLRRGDLIHAQEEAERCARRFASTDPAWARKFKILQAEALLLRGMYPNVLNLLDKPDPSDTRGSLIQVLTIEGATHARLHHFTEAQEKLRKADELCKVQEESTCGDMLRAWGVLSLQQGQPAESRHFFEQSLTFARLHGDQFLAATALLNLGLQSLAEQHYDEAIDSTDAAYRIASTLGAEVIAIKALGNLGWAYYNLGDSEKSLELSLQAEEHAHQSGDLIDELSWITNAGYVYQQSQDYPRARQSYLKALQLAQKTNGKEDIYNALRALALVSAQTGELQESRNYADQAIAIARGDHNRLNELYPLFAEGLIAAQSRDQAGAEHTFREIEQDQSSNAMLRWRAQHALARLYDDQKRFGDADSAYRAALATFEAARSSLERNDAKLPFSNNASHIYDDYIHFLVGREKSDEGLRWADYSRARTLAEGLQGAAKGKATLASLHPPNPNAIAQRAHGVILFYWLGEKQSYLWAVTPQKTNLYSLPPASEINAAVQRYRKALGGPQDVLESADRDGRYLYDTLVVPARSALPLNANVFIVPDGSLNNLNFDTLLATGPKLHFWIEDATIANASSLRLLGASSSGATAKRKLLLIGNSIAPSDRYPELPKASAQMDSVASHFSPGARKILARDQATPAAYFSSDPSQFSFIHFVAHGTASRLSPLDSAIVLSKSSAEDDSFKLYARDIVRRPLQAQLVTISSCYGAGERAYSGEGLVGLSWAFLRAGAHNVIAALWEASDASTEQLMRKFYDEIEQGRSPDAALRAAKLSLLHGNSFHSPFYWAPFQLYVGSSAGSGENSRLLQASSDAPSH